MNAGARVPRSVSMKVDLLRFNGEAVVQLGAIFSIWFGFVESSAE
jgi:hypothetical protein